MIVALTQIDDECRRPVAHPGYSSPLVLVAWKWLATLGGKLGIKTIRATVKEIDGNASESGGVAVEQVLA